MGCTASKLDNEDNVRRCKERCRFMKDAVHARHHLAAAHADYCRSLRFTGAALSAFSSGEPLRVLNAPPVVLHRTTSSLSRSSTIPPPRFSPSPSLHHPPPPPLSRSSSIHPPPPLSRSSSIHPPPPPPAFSPSPAVSRSKPPHSSRRNPKPIKVPHILSDSSPSSSPNPNVSAYYAVPNSTYSSTPSQASSVWNWENFYPPSPPDSEFFQQRRENHTDRYENYSDRPEKHFDRHDPTDPRFPDHRHEKSFDRRSTQASEFSHRRGSGFVDDCDETEREEVQCSEWEDHYSSTTSSSDNEEDVDCVRDFRSETRSNVGPATVSKYAPPKYAAAPMSKAEKADEVCSSVGWDAAGSHEINETKMVVSHKDLKEIVDAIKEYFDKAAASGEQLSELLEAGRAQLDHSFRQLKKTVYHSSNVFSNLSSTWTSKPPLAVKYRIDTTSLVESGGSKSLCSSLERLLAWEKKLYEEVKAREGAKIMHEKKLAILQNQEYKGEDETKMDKTKTSIKKLQSVIIVTSQAVSTTSSAINDLKDSDLVQQLISLCHGLKYMWKAMNEFHEVQSCIVQQVRALVNQSAKGESTSDLHRQVTRELESAVSAWHSSFSRLIKYQRDFIQSLYGWLKLSLIPVSNDNGNAKREPTEAFAFCEEWKLALDRIPDTVASEAIKSFVNVVHAISVKQSEELKVKKRTETASKDLEKKASSIRNLEKKFYQSYSVVGLGVPDSGPGTGHALNAHDPLAEKKVELAACKRRVEDEASNFSRAVEMTRAMTLNNIQTGLPGVFQAMTSFSGLFVEAMEAVCTRSYAIK